MRRTGEEDLVVDLNGKDLFNPQSPRARDDEGLAIACCTGCGRVAESETLGPPPVLSSFGRARGRGSENSLEPRSSLAVGESALLDMIKQSVKGLLFDVWMYHDTFVKFRLCSADVAPRQLNLAGTYPA